jgi:hypothetical protein
MPVCCETQKIGEYTNLKIIHRVTIMGVFNRLEKCKTCGKTVLDKESIDFSAKCLFKTFFTLISIW